MKGLNAFVIIRRMQNSIESTADAFADGLLYKHANEIHLWTIDVIQCKQNTMKGLNSFVGIRRMQNSIESTANVFADGNFINMLMKSIDRCYSM